MLYSLNKILKKWWQNRKNAGEVREICQSGKVGAMKYEITVLIVSTVIENYECAELNIYFCHVLSDCDQKIFPKFSILLQYNIYNKISISYNSGLAQKWQWLYLWQCGQISALSLLASKLICQ